jgi:hypothetical protein
MGDALSLDQFLELVPSVWSDLKDDLDDRNWTIVRTSVLALFSSISRAIVVRAQSNSKDLGERDPRRDALLVAVLAKTYSYLMKISVDDKSTTDFEVVTASFSDAFNSTLQMFRMWATSDDDTFPSFATRYVGASILGVEAWILYLWRIGRASTDLVRQLRASLASSRRDPWPALGVINSARWSAFFGWSNWEIFQREKPTGTFLYMGSYLTDALLATAAELGSKPTLSSFLIGDEEVQSIDGVRSGAEQLSQRLNELAESTEWRELNIPEAGISVVDEGLREVLGQVTDELTDELISMNLDPEKVQMFVTSVLEGWMTQERVMELLPSQRWLVKDGESSGQVNHLSWIFLGPYVTVSKDFFSRTRVVADPAMLGFQFVRTLAQSEAQILRTALLTRLERQGATRSALTTKVRDEVIRQRNMNLDPVVILFGPFTLLDTLRDASSIDEPHGIGFAGEIDGARIFWEIAVESDLCVVFDPAVAGRVWWRPIEIEDAEGATVVIDDRRTVEVRSIDEAVAFDLASERSETGQEAIREIRQQVLARFQELVSVEIFEGAKGVAFEVLN